MGVQDQSFFDFMQKKVWSWIADIPWISFTHSSMSDSIGNITLCHECHSPLMEPVCDGHRCRSCGRLFCIRCMYTQPNLQSENTGGYQSDLCRFCSRAVLATNTSVAEKLEHPRPRTEFWLFERGFRPHMMQYCSSLNLDHSITRGYRGEGDRDCGKYPLSPSSVFSQDALELETNGLSTPADCHSCRLSPFVSPHKPLDNWSESFCASVPQLETEHLIEKHTGDCQNNFTILPNLQIEDAQQKPYDLDNNGLIWLPPPPKDAVNDMKCNFIKYDYDDDDGDVGFKSCSFDGDTFLERKNTSDAPMELGKASVYKHFQALVFYFLKVENICTVDNYLENNWLEIVSSLAWRAANYVKPNTSKGGSMDPGDYVKVKCISTGNPRDSAFIKGVVCTKNVKHKRMITQHRNPNVLIMGGALEYQKVPDKLASINTVLKQESDHLKIHFANIEAHKPNVVLVEKSVSPHAVDHMLAKGISLVSNVKRPLLERISRCTGARITNSVDDLSNASPGHCKTFHIDRVPDAGSSNQSNKKTTKTLMFFEGCPGHLGCTVILRGACIEELKKVKHAIQYACFAAYHLSLETSFLADEGATLPEVPLSTSNIAQDVEDSISTPSISELQHLVMELQEKNSHGFPSPLQCSKISSPNIIFHCNNFEEAKMESSLNYSSENSNPAAPKDLTIYGVENENAIFGIQNLDLNSDIPVDIKVNDVDFKSKINDGNKISQEYLSASESNQSILVSLSKSCFSKDTTCEKPHLFRIRFYGNFDKPLGMYLYDYIFDQIPCLHCKEPTDAHVRCYTHQNGNLTISVKRLLFTELPGEHDGKIWMWHRCLKCSQKDGVPPAANRVVMSDAAWGLSFGKFLELSFSNHSTANRVASCGHSLQRDCLRFFGFGNMVACFRYSPVDILVVHLPPSILEFTYHIEQEWLQKEALEVSGKMKKIFAVVLDKLLIIEQKIASAEYDNIRESLLNKVTCLKSSLQREERNFHVLFLSSNMENTQCYKMTLNILALNKFRRSLLIHSYIWDRNIFHLDSLLLQNQKFTPNIESFLVKDGVKAWKDISQNERVDCLLGKSETEALMDDEDLESIESDLSDTIDLAWTGSNRSIKARLLNNSGVSFDHFQNKNAMPPVRFYSFDSTRKSKERIHWSFPDDSEDPWVFYNANFATIQRVYSQKSSKDFQNSRLLLPHMQTFVSSVSNLVYDGARLLLPESIYDDIFVAVYENEPSSIISYAICSKEHSDFVTSVEKHGQNIGEAIKGSSNKLDHQHRSQLSEKNIRCESSDNPDGSLSLLASNPSDSKQYHFRFSFEDEFSFPADKVKFSVTCYFAKRFFALRKKCCPNEMDFIQSLSRCRKWSADGGKSNVYFAKSLDERFIIKQVTKTEFDAFEKFAPDYFKYLMESIQSGSPTCLAKVLGIYQVSVKHLKGGKEEKMDLMVMENLLFGRNITRVYDLKGSSRSRYIPVSSTGSNKVLLDLNLLETLRTNPIFLGSKAKRKLERAVWNDTAFLSSVDVMDYSLLVGVDKEKKELVIGIIDFMRQYTWDKQLETWVKASGFLGGSKNETPTVVSPDLYKKRFRKAMSSYFFTVPDQWSS